MTGPSPRRGEGEGRPLVMATGAALAAATGLSLWGLTRKPLWIDEAFSLGATSQLVATIRGSAGTMAAYYVLLDGWTALFGTSRAALRSLSLTLCLVALVLVAAVARRMVRPREAVAAVLLTATLPGLVRIAQDARSYGLVLVVTTACWLVLSHLVEAESDGPSGRRGWTWALALVPLVVVGPLGHGLFVLQVAAMGLSLLAHRRRRALVVRFLPASIATLGVTGALWSAGARDVADWVPALSRDQVWPVTGMFLGYRGWVQLLLGALIIAGVAVLARRSEEGSYRRWAARAPLWWGLAPVVLLLALSVVRPSFLPRYVLASLPGLGLLLAVGTVRAWSWSGARLDPRSGGGRATRSAAAVVLVAVLAGTLVTGHASRWDIIYEEWDRAAELVAAEARPGDGLVFTYTGDDQAVRDTVRAPFEAAWREVEPRAVPVALSPARPLGQVRRFDDLTPFPELRQRMLAHERVWVVQFSGFAPSLDDLLGAEPAASAFRKERVDTFDRGVQVVLLVRT